MTLRSLVARVPGARRAYAAVRRAGMAIGLIERPPSVTTDDSPPSWRVRIDLARLAVANRRSRRSVVSPDGRAVVAVTTHGDRIHRVHVALESIARGSVRPRRLMLWLDDPDLGLTPEIRRLEARGLEVLRTELPGLRVHTKYLPYVRSEAAHELPLVTADDDIVYPREWLAELLGAHDRHPAAVVAMRAHRIALDDQGFRPYAEWTPCTSTIPSFRNFGTSVSGQLWPARLLDFMRDHTVDFAPFAPTADDVWLHHLAVEAGYPVVQVTDRQQHFPWVPGTQAVGLYMINHWDSQNDVQIAASYTHDDLGRIRSAP